jgi:CheY-like chemotaxis protein
MAEGVLVVDDDPGIREVLELVLRGEGYDVALACDGQVALEHLERQRLGLILLDLAMPRMDGPALVEALRQRGLHPGIPILVLSAGCAEEAVTQLGAAGFVNKPFELNALLAEVGRILDQPTQGRVRHRTEAADRGVAKAASAGGDTGEVPPSGPLVLVCEDDPMVSDFFLDALTVFGYRAVGASDGEDALRLAAALRPSAIVLDLGLPGLDGGATLARLKGDPRTADIPVVVASAHPGWLTFLDRSQVVAVLEKPCLPTDLHAAVEQALASIPVT